MNENELVKLKESRRLTKELEKVLDDKLLVLLKKRDELIVKKDKINETEDEIKTEISIIETNIEDLLEKTGMEEKIINKNKIVIETIVTSKILDWHELLDLIAKNDHESLDYRDLLKKEIKIGVLKKYIKEHNFIPSGLKLNSYKKLKITKIKQRGK